LRAPRRQDTMHGCICRQLCYGEVVYLFLHTVYFANAWCSIIGFFSSATLTLGFLRRFERTETVLQQQDTHRIGKPTLLSFPVSLVEQEEKRHPHVELTVETCVTPLFLGILGTLTTCLHYPHAYDPSLLYVSYMIAFHSINLLPLASLYFIHKFPS